MATGRTNVESGYLRFYVGGMSFLYSLKGKEIIVLFYIFKFLGYCNLVTITPKFKKNIEIALNISQSTVSKALKGLKSKGVIYPINKPAIQKIYEKHTNDMYFTHMYFVNPHIIGKGTPKELDKLRRVFLVEYD